MKPLNHRLSVANAALACFAAETTLTVEPKRGIVVNWTTYSGTEHQSKRWVTMRGQDFYPSWHRQWGHGGTATTALSQLVRWLRDRPVLPLSTWRHWASPTCYLFRERGAEVLKLLADGGYPDEALCVLCKQPINGGIDWWSLNKVSGPCCSWTSGCRQKQTA